MPRIAVLKAKNGTYTDKQTGQQKTSYMIVGSVIEGSNGRSYKLDAIPCGFDGWLFEADLPPKKEYGVSKGNSAPAEDDVPF
jgi:hypothetical protein